MGSPGPVLDTLYKTWRRAESAYAQALDAFAGESLPAEVTRDAALALARSRNAADRARDAYFRQALK